VTEPIRRRPKTPFTLSPTSTLGPFLAIGGIIAEDDQQTFLGGDITAQTERVLDSLEVKLRDLNATMEDAVAISVYLKRHEDFMAMNDVYRRVWPRNAPTRTTIMAGLRHPDALIEITAMVVPKGSQRDIIQPHAWRPSPNPYSYAIRSGRTLFMSGLVPRSPIDGTLIPGDVRTQTTAILDNAKELLKAADMDLGDIINAKVFLTDASQFEAMHSVYRTYFPIDPPACTTAVTQLMNPGFSVEMTLMAVRSKYRLTMPPGPEHGALQLSAFVQAEGRLFVSGMRGDTPEARHNAGAQALEALQRLTRLLKRARFSWRELREIVIYVSDISHAPAVMYELAPFLPVFRRPSGVIVETGLLAPGALVEITGTFARDRWRWR
jgi:2-iminobutanoate/2-iminopropanoate deaminase